MKAFRACSSVLYEIAGDMFTDLPSGGAAFLQSHCDYCEKNAFCLVIDNTHRQYSPARVCIDCINVLWERPGLE